MSTSNQKLVNIAQGSDRRALSRAQKQFNRLSENIAAERERLREWQDTLALYQQRIGQDYEPLRKEYLQSRAELADLLDRAYDKPELKAGERKKIKHLLCAMTSDLLVEQDDPRLKEIYNRFSASDFDTAQAEADAEAGEALKALLEGMFGREFGDDVDVSSPEKAEVAFKAAAAQAQERVQRTEERRSNRKKTAKQLQKEAREREEQQNAGKSIQEVFRKLAAALHPDREQDPRERERKTELMQRVNIAYGKKDLLQLLELQLQVEQIDQAHLDNIAEDRLQYFNKVLKGQLAELQQEIATLEAPIKMSLGFPPYMLLTPKKLLQLVKKDIKTMKDEVADLRRDLQALRNVSSLKAWLKAYTLPRKRKYDDADYDLFDPFGSPFGY
jgi:hypothetical protein